MPQGTVRWFNPTKGYGFIQPDDNSGDVFVHVTAVHKAGLETLNEGQKLTYDLLSQAPRPAPEGKNSGKFSRDSKPNHKSDHNKSSAVNLKLI